jgi:CRISPR system Cascade subunit CasE
MYLSRVLLNDRNRTTQQALAAPQILHAAVESCFDRNSKRSEDSRDRLLWRIDYIADKCYLLLMSREQPNLSSLATQFGYPDDPSLKETKAYGPFLERLREGQRWRFRLRANPVRSSPRESDERTGRGKVFAHVTHDQQKNWLLMRANVNGFSLDPEEFTVVHSEWKKFYKSSRGGHQVVIRTATYEGMLTISDVERFRIALTKGIGRAKAYGCGLITVARPVEG